MPVRMAKNDLIPYPLIKDYKDGKSILYSRLDAIIGKVFSQESEVHPVLRDIMARVQDVSAPDDQRAFLTEFESPYESGRSVLLLSAASGQALENAAEALLEPSVQSRCNGGLVVLDGE